MEASLSSVACRRRALRHRGAERHGRAQRWPSARAPQSSSASDVVEERDGDLMGDGGNIAARLEGIADPGGICLSEDAYRQVRDRVKERFTDLGEKELKNIARAVRAYAIKSGSTGPASETLGPAPDKASPPRLSIVVLPFANLGGDPGRSTSSTV
jgi:class 3 adenylate cyclase